MFSTMFLKLKMNEYIFVSVIFEVIGQVKNYEFGSETFFLQYVQYRFLPLLALFIIALKSEDFFFQNLGIKSLSFGKMST
jgi:hypothetical protein